MDISLQKVEYRYQENSPFERLAIEDVSFDIPSGSYVAVIGHTGSGKSTILQHLNALLTPSKGKVVIGDRTLEGGQKHKNLRSIRQRVGIVFQFPEQQLFEETVEKDICFGPLNFGIPESEAKIRAVKALSEVGLSEDFLMKSPFDLSGGQMRRIAIAGVLAMEPDVLVLDEPTAGLDPRGRREIMDMFYKLHKERNLTTVLVTHSMEDAAHYADQIVIMNKGKVHRQGTPIEIFKEAEDLAAIGLNVPEVVRFQKKVEAKFGVKMERVHLNMEDFTDELAVYLQKKVGSS
ncbi:energy-coupling factor ABC transporter ATP-binding protein [Niallia circulans]|jgi:energy-coupling factor transport system ATP-binding protein|uniref:Energy-coupling factor transporter ATP-binding protein EcfA2 n=1 Tax=Niallia circulans TaxID=1397 RepID=A0A268F6W1_NIACI|nr:energy-coupling factor ABC transporter ATP-binding protein [Niallia circulans]AYV68887.1 energy-coupling factor ABC transporter ATP-binding protein [Niallia circulans]AYV72722.1 energy-coupling factor ABC transporter ATP-binding protein [Niallia circulans]NRG27531.1 energy-coupling factor ABC transporter ATP-binding protein [Niallia circulans]PAD81115.1 energy-coupling factor ABC transporter ATP-binding protein [Niallia circulans]QJX60365.1 energy-coupling factor ABC transporter ATP-binding